MSKKAPATFLERAMRGAQALADVRVFRALESLASNTRLALTDEAASARISAGADGGYLIEVSPRFVRSWARSDRDALFLLMHELLHRVRGDFSRASCQARLSDEGMNVATDILVNAHLLRLAFPEPPALLARIYRVERFPANLLLPPSAMAHEMRSRDPGWAPFDVSHAELAGVRDRPEAMLRLTNMVAEVFRASGAPDPPRLAELYLDGWLRSDSGPHFIARFAEIMSREFPSLRRLLAEVVLLGHHGDVEWDRNTRAVVAALDVGRRAGRSSHVESSTLGHIESASDRAFFEAVRMAVCSDAGSPRFRSGMVGVPGVVGVPGRREAAFLACGILPPFYRTIASAPDETEERVHVFLDVSGSTSQYQRLLYGLTIRLGEQIGNTVFLFSNVVVPVSIDELEKGKCASTGGTDFDCVLQHALDRNFTRIIIVTDGFGEFRDALAARARARRLRLFLVLTEHRGQHTPLVRIAEKWWVMRARRQR